MSHKRSKFRSRRKHIMKAASNKFPGGHRHSQTISSHYSHHDSQIKQKHKVYSHFKRNSAVVANSGLFASPLWSQENDDSMQIENLDSVSVQNTSFSSHHNNSSWRYQWKEKSTSRTIKR